jgi:RNB domain
MTATMHAIIDHYNGAKYLLKLWSILSLLHYSKSFSPRLYRIRIRHPINNAQKNKCHNLHLIRHMAEKEMVADCSNEYLNKRLEKHGFSKRRLTIASSDLPLVVEVHHAGTWSLGHMISFQLPTKHGSPPRVQVQLLNNHGDEDVAAAAGVVMMDLGQVTYIWKSPPSPFPSADWKEQVQQELDHFPIRHTEQAMQRLYANAVINQDNGGLTKKDVTQMIQDAPEIDRPHTDEVLRKLVKTGKNMGRLVDSTMAAEILFEQYSGSLIQHAVAGQVLAMDADLGGRFKRLSCTAVAFQTSDGDGEGKPSSCMLSIINGGWLALDESVRAGTEARKFAKRTDGPLRTVADERIAHRLECLAMGQMLEQINIHVENDHRELEVDVREALQAMNLPISPDGAQEALVKIGRWSKDSTTIKLEPWSKDTLDAAKWYAAMDIERRNILKETKLNNVEGRLDLTMVPCVCIDAERTTFRDDAIGIRPRSMTGRKVVIDASKWEVMVHIADVTDIYTSNKNSRFTSLLQEAATNRGMSRYDLPLGPLHLMPPLVLKALSLDTTKVNPTANTASESVGVNRCVTLWAYIDERTGKIMDAGVERTLISKPKALSFAEATTLLETNPQLDSRHPLMAARSILAVVDRILTLWSVQQTQDNANSKKREERLVVRELVAKEQYQGNGRDDGSNGFQRSRGHRLVDVALDMHGFALRGLLRRSKAPVPMASGVKDGGRVGTAPLRRFVDGMAQRQAVSVLCNFGGPPLTSEDCKVINQQMDQARNNLSNLSATKDRVNPNQLESLRALQAYLVDRSTPILSALSTGRENEVTIEGIGTIAKCKGVKGTLGPGAKVNVTVVNMNPEKGILVVTLVN